MIHIRFPEFDRCSGDLRLTNLLQIIAKKHSVTLHMLYKPAEYVNLPENRRYLALLNQAGIRVRTGSLTTSLREQRYDAVMIEFWYVALPIIKPIRALQPGAHILVDTEHVYFHSNHLKATTLGEDPRSAEMILSKQQELDTYARADLIIATTEEDGELLLKENEDLRIAAIPNIHDIPSLDNSAGAARTPNSIVFVGNFANNPSNTDAMVYFCANVLPLIRRRIPDATLTIVGNKPPAEVQALACDHVTVTGYVPETAPYLATSMVSICPLRYGAGLKGKIGEAMMHAVPVVTTSIGTQGMQARLNEDILVGDTPEEFSDLVVRVLQEPALWATLSRNGRNLIIQNYSFEAVAARIDKTMSGLELIPVIRYNIAKRIAWKVGNDIAEFLQRHVLWRLGRAGL